MPSGVSPHWDGQEALNRTEATCIHLSLWPLLSKNWQDFSGKQIFESEIKEKGVGWRAETPACRRCRKGPGTPRRLPPGPCVRARALMDLRRGDGGSDPNGRGSLPHVSPHSSSHSHPNLTVQEVWASLKLFQSYHKSKESQSLDFWAVEILQNVKKRPTSDSVLEISWYSFVSYCFLPLKLP